MNFIKPILCSALLATVLTSCGGGAKVLSTPIENIDSSPLKVSELTETQQHTWGHLDLVSDTIPGMSVEKAYNEIIMNKPGKTVIVAVIDSGIDIEHEDLNGVIWTNEKEIPNNGIDDDKNGYVDDIHGWNFLGDTYQEQLEYVRLLASGDTSNPDYARAEKEYNEEYTKYTNLKTQYDRILQQLTYADNLISKKLNKTNYTLADLETIKPGTDEELTTAVTVGKYILSLGFDDVDAAKADLKGSAESIIERLNYNLNKDFKGRKTGDNPDDLTDVGYGNGNVLPVVKDESHGTHVAGIIAAERNNGIGVNGVANNVQIMSLRVVSNGDEYDKDVALGIRYAVDNGAKIINGSFGKYYSPHSDWVRDAIAYASKHDVLIVMAAGNEGLDLDKDDHHYPTDNIDNGEELVDNFISVGALAPEYGPTMVADYSNYGKINVDVFAPGSKIYSTTPENEYKSYGGTSMASPAVAGVAALIRSYYPKLSAAQVKQVILDSGLPLKTKVIVGGDPSNEKDFSELSKSGKIVNAYNALILASQVK
ncbi:S8 family peptidase [Formosa haliotis]|uniref:S8 family peptidase n=1 Tax=Formosa haliotis TaxID=1555194 RepID=UPI000824D6DE|nr:S8 family peptidase [Formosa haliotis]